MTSVIVGRSTSKTKKCIAFTTLLIFFLSISTTVNACISSIPRMPRPSPGCQGHPLDAKAIPWMPRPSPGCQGHPLDAKAIPWMPRPSPGCQGHPLDAKAILSDCLHTLCRPSMFFLYKHKSIYVSFSPIPNHPSIFLSLRPCIWHNSYSKQKSNNILPSKFL